MHMFQSQEKKDTTNKDQELLDAVTELEDACDEVRQLLSIGIETVVSAPNQLIREQTAQDGVVGSVQNTVVFDLRFRGWIVGRSDALDGTCTWRSK